MAKKTNKVVSSKKIASTLNKTNPRRKKVTNDFKMPERSNRLPGEKLVGESITSYKPKKETLIEKFKGTWGRLGSKKKNGTKKKKTNRAKL